MQLQGRLLFHSLQVFHITLWGGLKDFRFGKEIMNFGMITGADCESNCAQYICGMLGSLAMGYSWGPEILRGFPVSCEIITVLDPC